MGRKSNKCASTLARLSSGMLMCLFLRHKATRQQGPGKSNSTCQMLSLKGQQATTYPDHQLRPKKPHHKSSCWRDPNSGNSLVAYSGTLEKHALINIVMRYQGRDEYNALDMQSTTIWYLIHLQMSKCQVREQSPERSWATMSPQSSGNTDTNQQTLS